MLMVHLGNETSMPLKYLSGSFIMNKLPLQIIEISIRIIMFIKKLNKF